MTGSGGRRRSVSLSSPIYRTLAAWAGAGGIAISAALEIAIRQWHARIESGVIEEWISAARITRRELDPSDPVSRMVSIGGDAFRLLELRSPELGVSKSLIAEFCAACRVQRAISEADIADDCERDLDEERIVESIDARTAHTVDRRRQRAAEARAIEERIERTRLANLTKSR